MNNLVNWNVEKIEMNRVGYGYMVPRLEASLTGNLTNKACSERVSLNDIMNELLSSITVVGSLEIENVIFNGPATIVFWSDGTKTIVKCNNDLYDKEKGLAMAMVKKFLGNEGNYYNVFRKWLNE